MLLVPRGPWTFTLSIYRAKIIHYLEKVVERRSFADDKLRGVLYVYFDYQERENQTPTAILADLLAQVLCLKRHVSESMTKTYNAWRDSDKMLSNGGYVSLLKSEAAAFHDLYLVLDGLDEYSNETKENEPKIIMDIISQLRKDFKVLVMSRYHRSISESITFDERIYIQATNEDLAAFLEWRIGSSEVLKKAIAAKDQNGGGSSFRTHSEFVQKSQGRWVEHFVWLQCMSFTDTNAIAFYLPNYRWRPLRDGSAQMRLRTFEVTGPTSTALPCDESRPNTKKIKAKRWQP